MERQTISIMKACELVGVSRRTIYNWIAAGKVEYVRTAGGSIRIFVVDQEQMGGFRQCGILERGRRQYPDTLVGRPSTSKSERLGTHLP